MAVAAEWSCRQAPRWQTWCLQPDWVHCHARWQGVERAVDLFPPPQHHRETAMGSGRAKANAVDERLPSFERRA